MKNFYPDSNIRYLINLSTKLAITPRLQEGKEGHNRFKYYSFAVISIVLMGASSSLYGVVVHFIPIFKVTSVVLRFCSTIAMSAMSIIAILVAVVNGDTWKTFMDLSRYLDQKLNKGKISENRKFKQTKLILWHLLVFCIIAYDAYLWYTIYGWSVFRFCIFRYVNIYHCFIIVIVALHFASALKGRYRAINKILIKTNDVHSVITKLIPKRSSLTTHLKSIDELTDYYLLLSELVDMFNKLFGWHIFFMTENLILLCLEVLNILILSIDNTQDAPHDFRTTFFFAALCPLLILFHGRVVLYCEEINNESRNTLTICYNLELAVNPQSTERRELIMLTEVICLLKPRTNAAGFYFINRGLISRVFAYLISYSVVLIQFNKQG